jgi:nitroreductase
MDTITAIHTRRSIRDYESRAVEREIIADILWDAAQAPTTPLSGPFLFHVIEGTARIADYGERAKQYAREHRPGSVGYSWADKWTSRFFSTRPW